ncbi:cyclic-phosphate processing receiver domain-containing protein [Massilia sp. ZL223]|uniref:cyclic-phosphate processing receiver domain-containing protein n=1 Tax=Massilia sp. ZL223 TaxID=2824904 RepID=UPI0027D96853|nr:cyclic-phosphate processing receiver domain-containing protein [Massilia sp. ZL223]
MHLMRKNSTVITTMQVRVRVDVQDGHPITWRSWLRQCMDEKANMAVFLDDERVTPEGWVRTYWPDEVIALLKTGQVTELSLDHDLGDDERGTGYTVLLWLEEQVVTVGMAPPAISVHSANASARLKMEAAIASIKRHARE